MSLLKSKFFLGVLVVVGLAVAGSASAAYMHTGTLKMGMTSSQVMELQKTLNMTSCKVAASGAGSMGMESSYFGGLTKAAVMCFQTANALVADGIVGSYTGGKLQNVTGGVTTGTPGCPTGALFNSMTGASCTNTTTLPSGCTSSAGFSTTTGVACNSNPSTPGSNGPLMGGAGSITVSGLSTYSNEDVGEGDNDAKIAAFEVEADDESDVEVTSVKVEFYQADTDVSQHLDDYVDGVSVWMGSTKVGDADVSDFSENSDVYSKSISLDGAIVKAGDTEKFIVAVDVMGNLDSGDIADDNWSVGVSSVRFEDAEGVVTTESVSLDIEDGVADDEVEEFFFPSDFASANDVELEADLTSDNPDEGVVIGDSNDETDVLMLSYDFTANGSDINVDELTFDITSSGADTNEVASELVLKWNDGDDEQSESIPDANATTDSIVFSDLDIDISEGDSMTFEVWATIKDIDNTPLTNGDTFQVELDTTATEATDESNEDLSGGSELSGSADGETQHLFTEAPMVTYKSSSITPVDNGNAAAESATATLTVEVKALGGTIYLNGDDETTAAKEGLGAAVVGADTLAAYEFVTSGDYTIFNSGADNEYYKITEGKTMTITINATITQAAAATVLGGLKIDEVLFGTDVTSDTTRSANVMNWSDLLDTLKSPKTTLVGV